MLYEPRESINPRTFALRHALLEELKFRQMTLSGAARAPLAALARALDVTYDQTTRHFVISGTGAAVVRVPLNDFRSYEARSDATAAHWQREDEILRANRALASQLVDRLLAPSVNEAP